MTKQDQIEKEYMQRELYVSSFEDIKNNAKGCNDKRFEELKNAIKDYPYWVFENENGRFVFTEGSLFFQSPMVDKNFERFPFFGNYYFHFVKPFDDYTVIGFDEYLYMLCFYEDKKEIKPLRINGCFGGDISIFSDNIIEQFHYSCGHACINNDKLVIVKPFSKDIKGYTLKNFKNIGLGELK